MKVCNQCGNSYEKRCRKCANDAQKRWRATHAKPAKPKVGTCPEKKRQRLARYKDTLKGKLVKLLTQAKARTNDKRYGNYERFEEIDIDRQFLADLWEQQGGRCALTGLLMTSDKSLKSVSLDRKIQDRGYTKKNVQLVCKFANLAKHTHSDEEIRSVLAELRQPAAG